MSKPENSGSSTTPTKVGGISLGGVNNPFITKSAGTKDKKQSKLK